MIKNRIRWQLVFYDLLILLSVCAFLLYFYDGHIKLSTLGILCQTLLSVFCIFVVRIAGNIYGQIWRYGGIQCYIKLLVADSVAFVINFILEETILVEQVLFPRLLSVSCMNLLLCLSIRMVYRYAYKCGNVRTVRGRIAYFLLRIFAGPRVELELKSEMSKIKVAIVGAGRTGVALASELMGNSNSAYTPRCYIDSNIDKVGRMIGGLPVIYEDDSVVKRLNELEIQEVFFAIPSLPDGERHKKYEKYLKAGYKIKVYDYPVMQTVGGKRQLREFDIEELLFRKPIDMFDEKTNAYYKDKVVLITGGGGSIGSELCRQLSKMNPKQIIVLDIYENGVYELQQDIKMIYGSKIDIRVEIVSITNKKGMERVFDTYKPDIVINAAAHKHVPLMEHNCIEAVENNIFGTINIIELCEQFSVDRFMMVSTDKAVNPTNVMGATKRVCEMIVQSYSKYGTVKYSATRFGNVLGSAGSVVPLFKKQIANGGPITLTDKRIIRYFMTIPEASQLVLQSGAMANNGELFVLDMGEPVKIYELAESMIRLSGMNNIKIIETGLRPGEKLYEELLVKTEELDKTENELIFIERDTAIDHDRIISLIDELQEACTTGNDDIVRETLKKIVPTYKNPNEINEAAIKNNIMSGDAYHDLVHNA